MDRLRKSSHAPLTRRLTSLTALRRGVRAYGTPTPEPMLARAFSHAQGAGVIGPGAQRLLRTALVDALTPSTEECEVVTTRPDLQRLLGAATAHLPTCFAAVLHVTDTLEDSIEYLEARPQRTTAAGPAEHDPVLWLATPGADNDVVHQTLECHPRTDLITLFNGPWPHGPTHFIDLDGPRRLPHDNLRLLTHEQAVVRLRAIDPPY